MKDTSPITIDKIHVIAEMAHAHEGNFETAMKIVDSAATHKADGIKFQLLLAEETLTASHPRFGHFKKMEMAQVEWKKLVERSHSLGLAVWFDVFGVESAEVASQWGIDGYKVHSSDVLNEPLLQWLGMQGKPVLLSCGGSTDIELINAIHILNSNGCSQTVLMHGFQAFPTKLEHTSIMELHRLRTGFGLSVGIMDHLDADDEMAHIIPLVAIGAGIVLIEKHVTLDRSLKGIDYYSSLNPGEFGKLVSNVRRVEVGIGRGAKRLWSIDEQKYRKMMKKTLVSKRDLSAGHQLSESDIVYKRAETDVFPLRLNMAVGKVLKKSVKVDEVITRDKLGMKIGALIGARIKSSRLPNKALLPVLNQPSIAHLLDRVKLSTTLDRIVLCIPEGEADQPLADIVKEKGVEVFRGDEKDVLDRLLGAARQYGLDVIVRITGDDILIDPEHLDKAVSYHMNTNADYTDAKELPSGTEVEVVAVDILEIIHAAANDRSQTEYLTQYITGQPYFNCNSLPVDGFYRKNYRLTLDTKEDYEVIQKVLSAVSSNERPYTLKDIIVFLEKNQEILGVNRGECSGGRLPDINTGLNLEKTLSVFQKSQI